MAALLSAPTLSASQFAEFIDPAPLCQCPRSATPTMSRSPLPRQSSCSSYASGSGSASGSYAFGAELYRAPTRDERRRRDSTPPPPPSQKRWSISLVRPRLRRSESDEPPRRASRSKSPVRAKSTKSAKSSSSGSRDDARYSVFSAFGGWGGGFGGGFGTLRKVDNHTALADVRLRSAAPSPGPSVGPSPGPCPSPQPLPCLEACTGPPSPAVPTFSSTASTLIDARDPFDALDDDGIIWLVPRSRRGSRDSRASSYTPAKPRWILQHAVPEPCCERGRECEQLSMADLKRDIHAARDAKGAAQPLPMPIPTRRRIERISNWGLPHSPKEDGVWSKLTVTWWRRKSA